jgi:RNA polymerase sigma factor (sigma-70 family)
MTPKEFNRSVDEFSDRIYRFLLKNLGDKERAKDIVQDSYEKLWMHVSEIEYCKVKSWLFSTSYNNMIDIIRKEQRISLIDEYKTEPEYNDQYSDINEILHTCLGKLSENLRSVILLRDYEGYSYDEIAEITGQTEAQVKINIYRGRVALRKMIGKIEIVI